MTLSEFRAATVEPADLSAPLRALWQDAAGYWDAAHRLVQDDDSADAAWVHAYLHRKEGDPGNAGYWYARAGRESATSPLGVEWENLAQALLAEVQ
jgi:hypothetical protein